MFLFESAQCVPKSSRLIRNTELSAFTVFYSIHVWNIHVGTLEGRL